jgi:Spy/CpxP family protein refolding chaperone
MRQSTIVQTLVACGLLIGLAAPVDSFARPPGGPGGPFQGRGPGPGPERFIEQHAEELGLSAETREAIERIVEEARDRSEDLRGELRDGHDEMRDLLMEAMPDEEAVMEQADAINALELQQRKNRLKAMIAIRGLLTPEQREKLVEIREGAAFRRNRGPRGACRKDIANVCPDAEPGRAWLACLSGAWDDLSEECRASFENGGRRGFRRGPRHGPPGD